MSKLLDLLQRISDGSPAPLGFGAARTARLPGLALVGLVTSDHQAGLAAAAQAGLDAVLVAGVGSAVDAKSLAESASDVPWGICLSALSGEDAQVCADAGADVLAFGLESAASSMAGEDELARILTVAPDLSDRQLRAVAALPVDCFTVDMTAVTGPWTLQDLVTVGSISRRTDKYVLVQVSAIPAKDDLTAVRDMGASGIILDLSGVSPEDLAGLKTALLEMPRPRRRRDRARATVPSAGFASAPTPSREDDDDDDDYDDYD
ncbi:MAG: hypothetical protein OXR67_07095 [Chloroflexota bacterium]|nr:hypothetical protein [Chloroflexota bacterium]